MFREQKEKPILDYQNDFDWWRDSGRVGDPAIETGLLNAFYNYEINVKYPMYTKERWTSKHTAQDTKKAMFEMGPGAQIKFMQVLYPLRIDRHNKYIPLCVSGTTGHEQSQALVL